MVVTLARGRRWVERIAAGLLLAWEPATFAWRASTALARVGENGAPAFLLFGFRALVIGVGIAAGRALWAGERHGAALGQVFFIGSAVAAVWTNATPYFPTLGAPSERPLRLAAVLTYYAAGWLCMRWLSQRSHRRGAPDTAQDS